MRPPNFKLVYDYIDLMNIVNLIYIHNYIYIIIIVIVIMNHKLLGYVHQLSYRKRGPTL